MNTIYAKTWATDCDILPVNKLNIVISGWPARSTIRFSNNTPIKNLNHVLWPF